MCLKPCDAQAECRSGYACRSTQNAQGTYCLPPIPEPPPGASDGEGCTQDSDCSGGTCITEADGFPGGYCTTLRCQDRTDCARNNGEDNRCLVQNNPSLCVRMCQTVNDCRAGYTCERVGGGQGICLPDDTQPITEDLANYPFPISCVDPGAQIYNVDYTIDPGTTSYMMTALARDGRELFPRTTALPMGQINYSSSSNDFQTIPAQLFGYVSPLITPAAPQLTAQLQSGTHTLELETNSSDLCTYLLQESTPGTTIDMNIYFVGVQGITSANAATNPNIQSILTQFDAVYAPSGVSVGTVRYLDITGADAQAYQIIRSEGDIAELVALSELPGMTYDDALSVNIFFVQTFALQGGAIGISQGLPGPAAIHGTGSSGVVFTSEFLGQQFQDFDGTLVDGNEYTGIVLAHELGHYIGLFHTTEQFGQGQDPLADTPVCSNPNNGDTACPDGTNLMFPFAGVTHTGMTSDQAYVVQVNPLTKD